MPSTNDGMMVVLSSPSGVGKTTLVRKIVSKKNYKISISYTTRKPRTSEKDGEDYYFVSKEKFVKLKKNNHFIETSENFNNLYGSPIKNIRKSNLLNKNILFDIDWRGARKIRKKFHKKDIIDVFILPPTVKELRKRLIKRGRDSNSRNS